MEDLNKLLKELVHHDPHFRQNAVRFLSQYFLDDSKRNLLKDDEKAKIVSSLLTRLEPSEDSIEVKGCTVKIFGQIAKFIKEAEVIQIFSKIITYITDEKATGKDIYVTCIKAILKEMSGTSCYTVGKVIIPEITKGIQLNNNEIRELCFDAFNDYINTFNYILVKESESVIKNKDSILQIATKIIKIDNESLRSKVTNFLGNFSVILNRVQMACLVELLIEQIKSAHVVQEKIAYLNALNSVAKNTGNRHNDYIKVILPLLYEFCNREYLESNSQDYDLNNDLAESGLSLMETYILKSTQLVKEEVEKIVKLVVELMDYDPYHSYDMADNDDYEINYGDGGYDYQYEPVVYADDSSWKVRRAAVRVIQSIVKARVELKRPTAYGIIESLVFNLREHEENTKLDIVACLNTYFKNLIVDDIDSGVNPTESGDGLQLNRQSSMLDSIVPRVIGKLTENIKKDLKSTNKNVKSAVMQLLSVLALIAPNELIVSFSELKENLESCLKENINALTFFAFLGRLLKSQKHCPEVYLLFEDLIKWIVIGLKNDYYKINIESLNVAFFLIPLLSQNLYEFKNYLELLYKEILPKFRANDIDQELKLVLVSTVGNLLLHAGQVLPQDSVEELFTIYLDKCKNENLRPLIFTWIIRILNEQTNVKFDNAVSQFIPFILDLVVKRSLHIQYQTLSLLETIFVKCPNALSGNEEKIIETLMTIADEESLLHLIYLILNSAHTKVKPEVLEKTLIQTIHILETSKLTGSNLNPLFDYVHNCARIISKEKLITHLKTFTDFNNMNHHKAKCLAIIAANGGVDDELIKTCVDKLNQNIDDNARKNVFNLLGETCLHSKASHTDLLVYLEKMLMTSSEDNKTSIALCLGKIGVSDPTSFAKNIVDKITKEQANFYYIAIREFLISERQHETDQGVMSVLFNFFVKSVTHEDEKLRIMCGECLGLIATLSEDILNEYIKYLKYDDDVIRATFFYGLKYIFNSKVTIKDENIHKLLQILVGGLRDSTLTVKQNAFNSLINFVHCHGAMIKPFYSDLMTIFAKEHIINTSLIDVVDIGGGMKIKNDKGLTIRKAIYSTIKLLLDAIPEKVNVTDSLQICLYGLDDTDDVQALAHGCLLKIAHLFPEAFISVLDNLVDNLKTKLDKLRPTGTSSSSMDVKKKADLVANIKRLFDELKKVHEIQENPKFVDLSNEIQTNIA